VADYVKILKQDIETEFVKKIFENWRFYAALSVIFLVVLLGFLCWQVVGIGNALDRCGVYVHSRASSPDKTREIIVYQIDCGATSGIDYTFVIAKFNESQPEKNGKKFYYLNPRDQHSKYSVAWLDSNTIKISAVGEWDSKDEAIPNFEDIKILYEIPK
jgi:hypothetical protein